MSTPMSHAVRLSPGLEEAQWAQIGAFRSGKADSPAVEMVSLTTDELAELRARAEGLELENQQLRKANDAQLALITQLRMLLAEAQSRLSPPF